MNVYSYYLYEGGDYFGKISFDLNKDSFYFFTSDDDTPRLIGDFKKLNNTYEITVDVTVNGTFVIQENTNVCVFTVNYNDGNFERTFTYRLVDEVLIIESPEGDSVEKLDKNLIQSLTQDKLLASDNFCMAPWMHMYMQSSGYVFPCCKNKKTLLGNLKNNTLKELWNSDKLKKIRLNMLTGKYVPSCEVCKLNEMRWGSSYRKFFNSNYSHHFDKVTATNEDGSVDAFNLAYADFRISNLCNFKCRTCSSHSSSAWYEDEKKLGWNSGKKTIFNVWDNVYPDLPYIVDTAEKINFAGGEPLMIKEHYDILDMLVEKKRFDVDLTYNTNFSNLKFFNRDICQTWKQFTNITVKASLDGIKDRGEYIRKGLVWKDFFNNRFYLHKEVPHCNFKIFVTVQIFNVLHLLEMYTYLTKFKFIDGSSTSFHLSFLEQPKIYDIRSLTKDFKQKVTKAYAEFKEQHNLSVELKQHFNKVLIYMNEKDYDTRSLFKDTTQKLDALRNENARNTFPELADYFDACEL